MTSRQLAFTVFPFLTAAAYAQPILGGNLPPLRPGYQAKDVSQFDLALSYLEEGDIARVQAIEWEVLWDPKGDYNFRGIDLAIQKMAEKKVLPLWQLQACPYPSSPWYSKPWSDWWLPSRTIWPKVVEMNTHIVQHIVNETKKYTNQVPMFQIWNEPEGGKPGGSSTSRYGEWKPELHELLYLLIKDLRSKGITKSQLVGPAVSSFGENRRSETAEYLSMMPPKKFDWLSECGYRDVHIRLSAPGANGNLDKARAGFQASLDWFKWVDSRFTWPKGQKIMASELYVTPGDVGVAINSDMTKYHEMAFDVLKASPFAYVAVWGLRPDEADAPNNTYLRYGGFGKALQKMRNAGGL